MVDLKQEGKETLHTIDVAPLMYSSNLINQTNAGVFNRWHTTIIK